MLLAGRSIAMQPALLRGASASASATASASASASAVAVSRQIRVPLAQRSAMAAVSARALSSSSSLSPSDANAACCTGLKLTPATRRTMSTDAVATPSERKTLSLTVADPVAMLSSISGRYQSTARIVMEYVDNSLDDAERLYRQQGGDSNAYPRPINIVVDIDKKRRWIHILDDCSGMDAAQLERLVVNVGLSGKRNVAFQNGRFGFGFHAFRAAAGRVVVHSRKANGPVLRMEVLKSQADAIAAPAPIDAAFPTESGTGTSVYIDDFNPEWFIDIDAASIKREIELHFERLLSRDNLNITVRDVTSTGVTSELDRHLASIKPHPCLSFDYSQIEGTDFQRTIELKDDNGKPCVVEVHLKVAKREYLGHRARFFGVGRRIGDVVSIQSFLRASKAKYALWGHPQLLGYIAVPNELSPVITRDEFLQSAVRSGMYSALIKLEPELKAALDAEMDKQRVVTLGRLEGVLGQILSRLHRGDARASKIKQKMVTGAGPDVDFDLDSTQTAADNKADQLAPVVEQAVVAGEETSVEQPEAEDKAPEPLPETPEKEQAPETPPKSESEKLADVVPKEKAQSRGAPPPFAIQFMQLPPAEDGTQRRCQRLDKVITINIAHPDFLERASYRQQRLQMNDRLSSYLAEIIGMYYRDDELKNMMFGVQGSTSGQSSETYYERTLDVISRFEHVMKKNMKSLQTELDRSTKGMSHEAPTDASAEEAAEGDYGESSEDSPLFGETKKKTRKRASKRD